MADSSVPTVNLTWGNPFDQIRPDGYWLSYTATKLSGVPLADEERTTVMEFFANETSSSNTSDHLYSLDDLMFYSHYQFMLVAVYGDDNSTAVSANVSMTAEGGEMTYMVYYTVLREMFTWCKFHGFH